MKLLPAAIAIACCVYAQEARAGECCGGSFGIGDRLAPMESAAAGFVFREIEEVAYWTSDGGILGRGPGQFERELRADATFTTRIGRRLSLNVDVPAISTWKRFDEETSSVGGGVGDITVAGRFELPSLLRSAPNVALTFSTSIPTGRPPWLGNSYATDVTGLGAAELRPGISVDKSWGPGWYAVLSGSVGFRTQFQGGGSTVQLGPRGQIVAAIGPTWPNLSLTFGALFEVEPSPTVNGQVIPDTGQRRLAALAVCAYDVDVAWTIVGGALVDLPIPQVGQNQPVGISPSLGVRYAWGIF